MQDPDIKSGRKPPVPDRHELARMRTRLANRRTFLAWCRTALSFMAFGFLLERVDLFLLSRHKEAGKILFDKLGALGQLAFLGGPVLLLFAGWRYFQAERELGAHKGELHIFPELFLVGVILLSALLYLIW